MAIRTQQASVATALLVLLAGCPSSGGTDGGATGAPSTAAGSDASTSTSSSGGSNDPKATTSHDASPDAGAEEAATAGGWSPPVLPTSSAACGSGQTSISAGETHDVLGGRTYHVWGPASYDRTKPWPVVVMFHGIETNGADFEAWFNMEDYVDGKAIVVYPDAVNGAWDLSGTSDLVFFDALVKDLGARYCIDPSRVLGFGFSDGAYFASYLGCMRAGYVKAVSAGDGGWGGPNGHECGRLPVLVTHRTSDSDEIVQNGRNNAAEWAKLDGCAGTPFVSNSALDCTTQTGCLAPGTVTYCEDTWFDSSWPTDWNHTVREPYRAYTWSWFASLP